MRIETVESVTALSMASRAELALVGEIAVLMGSGHAEAEVDTALERLRDRIDAAVCELFLADSKSGEMFLTTHSGADLAVFCDRDRFAVGEGFPGIVSLTGAAVWTEELATEADFLRTRVKALNYRLLVCVPLRRHERVAGCLLVAWKRAGIKAPEAVRLATLAAWVIGTVVDTAAAPERRDERRSTLPGLQEGVEALRTVTEADGCLLRLRGTDSDELATAALAGALAHSEPYGPTGMASSRSCPALMTGRVQVLGGREGWPGPCIQAGCTAKVCYCIPLLSGERVHGILSLTYRTAPLPRTRRLFAALRMRDHLLALVESHSARCPTESFGTAPARLRIRCFGDFEVVIDGRRLGRGELARDKARELLALLVAADGRPESGVRLAEQLWPGIDPSRARNRFHVTLSALRSAIEPDHAPPWIHIRRSGHSYFLDQASSVEVDLWRFRQLLGASRSAEARRSDPRAALELVDQAAALCAGELFAGAFHGAWADSASARCRQEMLEIQARAARLHAQLGDEEALSPAGAVGSHWKEPRLDPVEVLGSPGARRNGRASLNGLRATDPSR